jgi:hypothetical protein
MKRSQSECLTLNSRIYSPSPINKKVSRICVNVARELFDIPPQIDEFDFDMDCTPLPNFGKSKSYAFRTDTDYSSTEWSSESGLSGNGVPGDCESPTRGATKNPMSQDTIFEEISAEIPSRTSNPIVFDTKFKRYDQKKAFGFQLYSINSKGLNATN